MEDTDTPYSIAEFTSDFFDNASTSWKKNKKFKKHRMVGYKCCWIHKNGRRCIKTTMDSKIDNKYIYTMDYTITSNIKKNRSVFCKQHINRFYCESIHVF